MKTQLLRTIVTPAAWRMDSEADFFGDFDVVEEDDTCKDELQSFGISTADYDTCLRVMQIVADGGAPVANSAALREFRQIGMSIFHGDAALVGQPYGGLTKSEYLLKLVQMRDRHAREQKARALDRDMRNKRQLRAQRKEQMAQLMGPPLQSLIEYPVTETTPGSEGVLQSETADSNNADALFMELVQGRGADGNNSGDQEQYFTYMSCYSCKKRFQEVHFFYDQLCGECAALNWEKRNQTCDLTGYTAIVTGSRVKIGFHITLKLLQWGCTVIATTRFPTDALERFTRQPDFNEWRDRLKIYALDLRDIAAVRAFCAWCGTNYPSLDILINNAAQTVKRPPAYYRTLIAAEQKQLPLLEKSELDMLVHRSCGQELVPSTVSAAEEAEEKEKHDGNGDLLLGEGEDDRYFPAGLVDEHGQQVDLRGKNSWTMQIQEVNPLELLEVHMVNAFSPFVLNGHLKTVLAARMNTRPWSYIVNVSAMEGKFYRHKTPNHPHTNMAKAALNMMTRTCAQEYATHQIAMTAVDTGWITEENPVPIALRTRENNDFQTPIDEVDAAARILDPIVHGLRTGTPQIGLFLKDYKESEW